jgi:hypothetical protein
MRMLQYPGMEVIYLSRMCVFLWAVTYDSSMAAASLLTHPALHADNQGKPIKLIKGFYEGDRFRPYLPAINPNVTDSAGRPFPGNTAEAAGQQSVVCSSNSTLRVRIIDSCPCKQVRQSRSL